MIEYLLVLTETTTYYHSLDVECRWDLSDQVRAQLALNNERHRLNTIENKKFELLGDFISRIYN